MNNRNTNHNNNNNQLELELDCTPENHHARVVVGMLTQLKKLVIRALEDKAGQTPRGRILRESGAIRLFVGTSGRYLQFGPLVEEDETKQLQSWRRVVSMCLDTLSAAIAFGYFVEDMEAVWALDEKDQPEAMARMVADVKKRGGLMWERDRRVSLKGVDKIFKECKEMQSIFGKWRMVTPVEVPKAAPKNSETARLRAEADAVEKANEKLKAETDRIAKAAAELAAKGEADKAELASLQGQRLEQIGTPNVVAEVPTEATEEVVLPAPTEGGQPT